VIEITGQNEVIKALNAKVKTTRDKAILWARRWSVLIRNNAADHLVWHNLGSDAGGRGVTGALRRSIQFDLQPEEKQIVSLVGISSNSPAINYAKFVEGPPAISTIPRRHFLSFARHPEFLRWARAHGIKVKTTKTGKFSPAGTMVGGKCFRFMGAAFDALGNQALKDGEQIAN
jgi:hypothetical protein